MLEIVGNHSNRRFVTLESMGNLSNRLSVMLDSLGNLSNGPFVTLEQIGTRWKHLERPVRNVGNRRKPFELTSRNVGNPWTPFELYLWETVDSDDAGPKTMICCCCCCCYPSCCFVFFSTGHLNWPHFLVRAGSPPSLWTDAFDTADAAVVAGKATCTAPSAHAKGLRRCKGLTLRSRGKGLARALSNVGEHCGAPC